MPKLSKISFFLFTSVYNYIYLRSIIFPFFYNNYGNMGLYYTGIIIVGIALLYLLTPLKFIVNYNKSSFKYFYNIILLIEASLGISFCVYLLSKIFISKGNFYIMLGCIIFVIGILSSNKPKDVINISTLFIIVGYLVLFLTLFFYPDLDFSLILPIKKNNILSITFFIVLLYLDNLKLLIYKEELNFSKSNFILAILFAITLFGIEYLILLTNSGDTYFKGLNWLGFISLSIEPITKYLGNFDFAYVFYIIVSCVFKYGYNLSLVKESIKNNRAINAVVYIILFILCIVWYRYIRFDELYFRITMGAVLISISLLAWFIKEYIYARKAKG